MYKDVFCKTGLQSVPCSELAQHIQSLGVNILYPRTNMVRPSSSTLQLYHLEIYSHMCTGTRTKMTIILWFVMTTKEWEGIKAMQALVHMTFIPQRPFWTIEPCGWGSERQICPLLGFASRKLHGAKPRNYKATVTMLVSITQKEKEKIALYVFPITTSKTVSRQHTCTGLQEGTSVDLRVRASFVKLNMCLNAGKKYCGSFHHRARF